MKKDTKDKSLQAKTFQNLLRLLRQEKGLTQEALSISSGISRQHISEIEAKGVVPTILTQEAFAKAFNLSLSQFLSLFAEEYEKEKLCRKKGVSKAEYLQVAERTKNKRYSTNKDENSIK